MSALGSINQKIAEKITKGVATMWAAYFFAAIALISLPSALRTKDVIIIVAWVAQTFLQLVLLSIIMVGQKVQSSAVEQKITETHTASVGEFELAKEARAIADEELKELKIMSKEIHRILTDLERKIVK